MDQIEALRATLREYLDAVQRIEPLMERIRKLQLKADEIGKLDPAFDMKNSRMKCGAMPDVFHAKRRALGIGASEFHSQPR